MLNNPLNRVVFRNKALDCFRFAIGPQNIDPPASSGIFPSHESWSLLETDLLAEIGHRAGNDFWSSEFRSRAGGPLGTPKLWRPQRILSPALEAVSF